jgi:catechol 2,3-dioxygenase-like lactoylglutathione lyase family enzyme
MKPALDHVSFTVSDMDKSIRFYRDIIGLKLLTGPADVGGEGTGTATIVGFPGARLRVAVLELSGDVFLELIQYLFPEGEKVMKTRRCDVGAAHIAFWTDDLPGAYEALKEKGVRFVAPPAKGSIGLLAAYFLDPDDYALEIRER